MVFFLLKFSSVFVRLIIQFCFWNFSFLLKWEPHVMILCGISSIENRGRVFILQSPRELFRSVNLFGACTSVCHSSNESALSFLIAIRIWKYRQVKKIRSFFLSFFSRLITYSEKFRLITIFAYNNLSSKHQFLFLKNLLSYDINSIFSSVFIRFLVESETLLLTNSVKIWIAWKWSKFNLVQVASDKWSGIKSPLKSLSLSPSLPLKTKFWYIILFTQNKFPPSNWSQNFNASNQIKIDPCLCAVCLYVFT